MSYISPQNLASTVMSNIRDELLSRKRMSLESQVQNFRRKQTIRYPMMMMKVDSLVAEYRMTRQPF